MKRDARIGLAVVLVLGLAVTLLIGRAIYKKGPDVSLESDEKTPSTGAAPYSSDVARVDGAADSSSMIIAAASSHANSTPGNPEVGSRQIEQPNPALQRFIKDQTPAPIPSVELPPISATPPNAKAAQTAINNNVSANGAVPIPTAPQADDSRLDHEQAVPPAPEGVAGEKQAQVEGFAYTIATGDNMWKISNKVFGDGKYTQKIVEANPGMNSQKLKTGSILRIPVIPNKTVLLKLPSFADGSKSTGASPPGKSAEPVSNTGPVSAETHVAAPEKTTESEFQTTTHKVESGESLSAIAKKYYGVSGPKTIARIVAANHGLDPAKLKSGQELTIPGKK